MVMQNNVIKYQVLMRLSWLLSSNRELIRGMIYPS